MLSATVESIEELWDWIKADVLKMHRMAGQWDQVKQNVTALLGQFGEGSDTLLDWVSLAGDDKLA